MGTIRHLIAEQRGDAWVVDGRVLVETSEGLPDIEVAALILEQADLEDAVVSLCRPDGASTSHRIRKRPEGL